MTAMLLASPRVGHALIDATLVASSALSEDIRALTFETAQPVAGCEPGAHVDVHLPDGRLRSYSLTHWDAAASRVSIAVKREAPGRGGSIAVHDLTLGQVVQLSEPRNNFPLVQDDAPPLLIAGGIGITPLFAMARALHERGTEFDLHYLVRTSAMAAFGPALRALGLGERYRLHCDDTDGLLDLTALLAGLAPQAPVYVCGPEPLLDAVLAASAATGHGRVIFERFALTESNTPGLGAAFTIQLASTGEELTIPGDRSILHVLREAGHDVEYSCGEGKCGSCILDVLEGEIEHRDSFLTDDEREAGDCMCICVSRARGPLIVLDL